jgi:hypothetical protein
MTRHLTRRLTRLAAQGQAGRVIVVEVAWPLVGESEQEDVVAGTLAAAGIDRSDEDLLVLAKRYGADEPNPPCALLSVSPLTGCDRKAQRP